MWNDEVRCLHYEISVERNVDVDYARAFRLRSQASHCPFYGKTSDEQFAWREQRIEGHSTIQKPRLREQLHRFGFIKGRLRCE